MQSYFVTVEWFRKTINQSPILIGTEAVEGGFTIYKMCHPKCTLFIVEVFCCCWPFFVSILFSNTTDKKGAIKFVAVHTKARRGRVDSTCSCQQKQQQQKFSPFSSSKKRAVSSFCSFFSLFLQPKSNA